MALKESSQFIPAPESLPKKEFDFSFYLQDYSQKASQVLEVIFEEMEEEASKISPLSREIIRIYHQFLLGGKRLRGGLVKLGYELFGGENEDKILPASLIMEIIHGALLIHDDIVDRDALRRGKPTIHKQFEARHRSQYQKGEASHYGLSMALDLGDVGAPIAFRLLADIDFPDRVKVENQRLLSETLLKTVFGQGLDIDHEYHLRNSEEDVLLIHQTKTAYYTTVLPLQFGATLAQAPREIFPNIEKYALPLGIAFQLRDDELGMYSDEASLGKPIGSDLREGKNTILFVKALEWADGEEKDFLKKTIGKPDISQEDVEKTRRILEKTGALAYSQYLAQRLVEEGKSFIPTLTQNAEDREKLKKVAEFMIAREK